MKVIILNSAPGAGKTTLLKLLEVKLPKGFAIIDGDDLGRIVPLKLSIEWLNLMQDNIVSCAKNYKDFGIEFLIVAFVFPSQERLDRLIRLLKSEDEDVSLVVSLVCDDEELRERINKRNTSRIMNVEKAIECNKSIKQLKCDYSIDTTQKKPEEVAKLFCDIIEKLVTV